MDKYTDQEARGFHLGYCLTILSIRAILFMGVGGLIWAKKHFWMNPGGNEFLPRWLGTRSFLTRGWSPYSLETTRQIQSMVYGRQAGSGED
jgi:hypothetical protein